MSDLRANSDLLFCPFCGGEAHIKEVVSACSVVYTVGCSDSECMGFETLLCKTTPEEAIAAWNRRAERTCRMAFDDVSSSLCCGPMLKCSKCRACVPREFSGPYNYCPSCGARVVSDDDRR